MTEYFKLVENKKMKIFLDMDGVVSDWLDSACKSLKIDITNKSIRDNLKMGKELPEACNSVSDEDVWSSIDMTGFEWWANLQLLPWAKELVERLSKMGDLAFLTSPGKRHDSAAISTHGKILWLKKHFPKIPFIITYVKEMCATPNSILIDDSKKKIDKFKNAGGKVFLFPNQYSLIDKDIDLEETIKELENIIRKLK